MHAALPPSGFACHPPPGLGQKICHISVCKHPDKQKFIFPVSKKCPQKLAGKIGSIIFFGFFLCFGSLFCFFFLGLFGFEALGETFEFVVDVYAFGRRFEEGGILEIFLDNGECLRVAVTVAEAFVHDDTERDLFFKHDLAFFLLGCVDVVAHGNDHAVRTEVINVMVDVVGTNARQIGENEGAVEGADVDDRLGEQTDLIESAERSAEEAHERTATDECLEELVSRGVAGGFVVFRNERLDLVVDVKNGIVKIKLHFAHGRIVVGGTKHDHADLQLVVGVDLAVDDEAVQLGEFGNGSDDSGNDDGQMAELDALLPAFQNVIVYVFIRYGYGDGVLRVTASAHEIGCECIHGVKVFYSFSIGSHNKIPFSNGKNLYASIIEYFRRSVKYNPKTQNAGIRFFWK